MERSTTSSSANNNADDDSNNKSQYYSSFNLIPNEIVEYLVCMLPIRSLMAFSFVCRRFSTVCAIDHIWKEHVFRIWDNKSYPLTWLPRQKGWKFIALCMTSMVEEAKTRNKVFSKGGVGAILYYDKRLYEGELCSINQCMTPHGIGLIASSMYKYEGQFKNGIREGNGKMICANGITYEGEWQESKKAGFGKKMLPNGDSYVGEFRNDKAHGKGVFRWNSGQSYEGDFVNDRAHGKGIMIWPNGVKYEGEISADKPHGCGSLVLPDGRRLKGEFKDGMLINSSGLLDSKVRFKQKSEIGPVATRV